MSTASVPAKGRAGALTKGESYKKVPSKIRSGRLSLILKLISTFRAPKQRVASSEVKRFAARSFV